MIPYLIIYAIAVTLAIISQATYKNNKKVSSLISLISILILSTFAALRGMSVGKDISVYGERLFMLAQKHNSLIDYIIAGKAEIGYLFVNFLTYKLFGNIHALFFILEFFNITCVYIIAYKDKNKGTFFFYILSYLLLWNNASLNIIRQSIAMIILLLSYKYLEEKKPLKYYVAVAIAFMFHKSSIIALINPLIYRLTDNKTVKIKYIAFISIAYAYIITNIRSVIGFLAKVIPSFKYYYNYLGRTGNFSASYFIMICAILLVTFIFSKYVRKKGKCSFLIYGIFLFTTLYLTSISFKYGYRISYPFILYYTILIPRIDRSLKGHNGRPLFRVAIILILLAHWYLRCLYYDSTIPYVLFWQ